MATEKKRPITIRIPHALRISLRVRAGQEDRPIESVAADALLDYLAKPLTKAQQQRASA